LKRRAAFLPSAGKCAQIARQSFLLERNGSKFQQGEQMNPEEFSRLRRTAAVSATPDRSSISGSAVWRGAVMVIAAALGQFCGINMVIPFVFALVVGFLAFKCFSQQRKAIVPAFCVQAGQWLWIAVGFFILEGHMSIVAEHPVGVLVFGIYGIALVWFAIKPDNTSLWFLVVFHVLYIPFNIYALMHTPFGSPLSKGIVVHIYIRCTALVFMWDLNRKWSNENAQQLESTQQA
jgi:hypothetical protein